MIDTTRTPLKMAYVLVALMFLDMLTTVVGVGMGFAEQNPLVHVVGLRGLLIAKVVMVVVVLWYGEKTISLCQEKRVNFCLVVAALIVIHVFVVRNNIHVIQGV